MQPFTLSGHTFNSLSEVIAKIEPIDASEHKYRVEPTDLLVQKWEEGRRGTLESFTLEYHAYNDGTSNYWLEGGSNWSNEHVSFWHTKLLSRVYPYHVVALLKNLEV